MCECVRFSLEAGCDTSTQPANGGEGGQGERGRSLGWVGEKNKWRHKCADLRPQGLICIIPHLHRSSLPNMTIFDAILYLICILTNHFFIASFRVGLICIMTRFAHWRAAASILHVNERFYGLIIWPHLHNYLICISAVDCFIFERIFHFISPKIWEFDKNVGKVDGVAGDMALHNWSN